MSKIIKQIGWAFLVLLAFSAVFSLFAPTPTESPQEISLSQLEKGIDGFDTGTGLSKPTIITAINGLIKNILDIYLPK